MSADPFQDLLELEDEFYQEGYRAGVTDSAYAGMVEGKVFGIEKGYEKAFELAKLHGRGIVWQSRLESSTKAVKTSSSSRGTQSPDTHPPASLNLLEQARSSLSPLPTNSRLPKHVDNLLSLTDGGKMSMENSDAAVMEFDDRLARAKTKAKVIANIAGETLNPTTSVNSGIEDATGLNARH